MPKLNFDIILGTNWCAKNDVDIKYSNSTIIINNHVISEPRVSFKSITTNNLTKAKHNLYENKIDKNSKQKSEIDINSK